MTDTEKQEKTDYYRWLTQMFSSAQYIGLINKDTPVSLSDDTFEKWLSELQAKNPRIFVVLLDITDLRIQVLYNNIKVF